MLLKKLARKDGNDFRIADARADACIRHTVGLGQRFGDLVLGAEAHLHQNFTQQLLVVREALCQLDSIGYYRHRCYSASRHRSRVLGSNVGTKAHDAHASGVGIFARTGFCVADFLPDRR